MFDGYHPASWRVVGSICGRDAASERGRLDAAIQRVCWKDGFCFTCFVVAETFHGTVIFLGGGTGSQLCGHGTVLGVPSFEVLEGTVARLHLYAYMQKTKDNSGRDFQN